MGFLKKEHKGGFADVIRCDEKNYLLWKWHPDKYDEGALKRETAIRTNSILRVKTGEVAVFVYNQKNGQSVDYITGPHDEKLKTKNMPVLSSIIGAWYEGDTPFQAEVFFINLAEIIQIKFGVPYFDVVDARYPDFQIPVAVRGSLTFKIDDYKRFVSLHQLATFTQEQLKEQVTDAISRYIKDAVTNAPQENDIPLIAIESKIDLINEKAELFVKERLLENFGLTVVGLDISAIETDKENEDYIELKKITKDIAVKKEEANLHDYEEQLRIKREEEQYVQRMGTRSANLSAFETEAKRDVGVAGAEALGKAGSNSSGSLESENHGGFNPMTIMAGMAVGSAIGQNIAGTMNNSMNQVNNPVPPSIPKVVYYIAQNNQPIGPFELNKLNEMIASGQVNRETLVWKNGTQTWEKAETFDEIKSLFPPKLPK